MDLVEALMILVCNMLFERLVLDGGWGRGQLPERENSVFLRNETVQVVLINDLFL